MNRSINFLLLGFIFLWHHALSPIDADSGSDKLALADLACSSTIEEFSRPEKLIFLLNPVITSGDQLAEIRREVSGLGECIQLIPQGNLDPDLHRLQTLVQYFLVFTNPETQPSSSLELVDLARSNDRAVAVLRDQIGLEPPKGWVFVRRYPSRQAMPGVVQALFENQQVAGVTILSKYVAILEEQSPSWFERAIQAQSSSGTYSHELVHAYVNSIIAGLPEPNSSDLPRWFDEGLASYISHSDYPHTIITPNLILRQTASEEYQDFSLIFKFLENQFGDAVLYEQIKIVVETGEIDRLYKNLGFPDQRWLETSVQTWQKERTQDRTIGGVIFLLGVIAAMYFALPEFRCSCGFTGKRKQFVGGFCPNCGEPVKFLHREYPNLASKIVPDCQICGNKYYPWKKNDLHIYQRMVKVWIENPAGNEKPLGRFVYRICQTCLEKSQEIADGYQHQVQQQIVTINQNSRPLFSKWLSGAPIIPGYVENTNKIPIEEAIGLFLDAAIVRLYGEWLELKNAIEIELLLPDNLQVKDTINPPDDYENIVFNHRTGASGSIFQADQNHIIIIWDG